MALEIVNFTPRFGRTGTIVSIQLSGMTKDFKKDNTKVYLGEDPVRRVNSVDPEEGMIKVMIDPSLRTGKFMVTGGADDDSTTAADEFKVGEDEKLKIDSFNPTSGGPKTVVTITLKGLGDGYSTANTTVYIGEEVLHDKTIDAHSGTIDVTIDDMARTGNFTVEGGNSRERATSADVFTVTGSDQTTPTISSIAGQDGSINPTFAPGDVALVKGRNLDAVTAVWMGGQKCGVLGAPTPIRVTFRVPMMPGGEYFVSITFGNQRLQYNRKVKIST
jgi:hypothetical protein